MKHKLLPTPERPLIKARVGQRTTIAALSMGGIDNRSIAIFTATHPKTVRRWVCRVEEGKPLTDVRRCGRPRCFSEAARLTTIAVYCQHSPPLPGIHLWSLRDAQRYFKEHPESIGGPISRATIHRILLDHALRPHRRKYYLQITDSDFFQRWNISLNAIPIPRRTYTVSTSVHVFRRSNVSRPTCPQPLISPLLRTLTIGAMAPPIC